MDWTKALKVCGLLGLVCTALLAGFIVFHFHYQDFYRAVIFYLDGSHADFRQWFPRFHGPLYVLGVLVKLSLLAAVAYLLFTVIRRRSWLTDRLAYNRTQGYVRFVLHEGVVLLFALCFYISLYFLAKGFTDKALFSGLQVMIARCFLLHLCFQITLVTVANRDRVLGRMRGLLLEPQLPYNIAFLRVAYFSYLIYLYLNMGHHAATTMTLEQRVHLPGIGWLIDIMPMGPDIYLWALRFAVVAAAMVALGFRTRLFLIINGVLCFYVFAAPNFFGKLWHQQLVIWISWFLMFSRCYDVMSVDALLRRKPVVRSADYTFPVRLVWLQLGVIYFWAGFYKFWDAGFDWALGPSMVNQVQLEWLQHYDTVPAIRVDRWPLLLHMGGLAVILFELGFILLLIRPKIRWMAALGGLVMHNTIGYFMYISFSMMLQAFYVFFVNINPLFGKGKAALAATTRAGYSRLALAFGLFVLSVNVVFGMLSIDSYPFSAYPKYSALIPDNILIIKWKVYLRDGQVVDAHDIGKMNGFRWEDYGWLEHILIRDFEAGEEVDSRIEGYWDVWQAHNPQLRVADSVSVMLIERNVAPEGRHDVLRVVQMGTVVKPRN